MADSPSEQSVAQSESGHPPLNKDPYFQDYEENERQVQLHRERVERWYIDNEAPIDPAKWRKVP